MTTKHGKKYNQAASLIEQDRIYTIDEAVDLLERTNTVKFDPTIEIHFNLGIDPRQADQLVRSTITLPHGTGKTKRIAAFTDIGNEAELKKVGVVAAGSDDLVDMIVQWTIDFDIAIATPGMMRKMGKIAKILWPKGLMPNPKAGTVGDDLIAIAEEISKGRFEFKNDKQWNIHSIVGKLSFGNKKLKENIEFFIKTLQSARPTGIKSASSYIKTAYVCNTMGPGIQININAQ